MNPRVKITGNWGSGAVRVSTCDTSFKKITMEQQEVILVPPLVTTRNLMSRRDEMDSLLSVSRLPVHVQFSTQRCTAKAFICTKPESSSTWSRCTSSMMQAGLVKATGRVTLGSVQYCLAFVPEAKPLVLYNSPVSSGTTLIVNGTDRELFVNEVVIPTPCKNCGLAYTSASTCSRVRISSGPVQGELAVEGSVVIVLNVLESVAPILQRKTSLQTWLGLPYYAKFMCN
jgi:hypothetical protein